MRKIVMAVMTAAVLAAFADDRQKGEASVRLEKHDAPLFWGFANYGVYSGYQLYGSLVNSEPTLQGYFEGNLNLRFDGLDLGYLGVGVWSNSDLTKQNDRIYGRAFNEWDSNLHWGRTFWFDDDETWGIDYHTSVVWYYYPHHWYQKHRDNGKVDTTMDWNHSVAIRNPYVVPFADFVHEYHETDGNLIQFGLRREFADVFDVEGLTLTPSVTFVWRNRNYGWCFPHYGLDESGRKVNSCLATMKLMLEGVYRICDHFGVFAKVAYCQIVDGDLREACEACDTADYGKYKEFVWGGVGVTFDF